MNDYYGSIRLYFFPLLRQDNCAGRHLKKRILVQNRGGTEFKTAGNLLVVEDLKRGPNKDIGPKDIFGLASKYSL